METAGCQDSDWLLRVLDVGSQRFRERESALQPAQPADCTAEPGASMDGVDVWASTLAQLMAKRKPQDTWELLPEENLASGHMESGGFQYRLRGLSRLQCGRCQWGWSSAHVHILFHVWFDEASRLGLVKMRLWGQRCRLCPPGDQGPCQASLLNVRLFLSKLVLFILQKCYGESLSAEQCPEVCFGERCEACDLGVCFFQKPPDPAWGPEVKSPSTIKGRYTLYGGDGMATAASGRQLLTLGSGPVVDRSRGYTPNSISIPLSVSDFIRNPISESSDFFNQDDDIVTVPFSLVKLGRDRGPGADAEGGVSPGGGARQAADPREPLFIGEGSIYLPTNPGATPKGRALLVRIRRPVFHGRGLLINSIRPFQLKGFIFKGRGSISSLTDPDQGQGAVPGSNGFRTTRRNSMPVSYLIGLTDDGEGSVTFPSSLANIVIEDDSFPFVDGSVTFPFIFTDGGKGKDASASATQGKEKEDGGRGREPHTRRPVTISEGSVTIPFSVFNIIKHMGPHSIAGGSPRSGLAPQGPQQKGRRPWARLGRPCSEPGWEEDPCWEDSCCRPRFDPYEEVWVWVSMTVCILWIMYLYKFSP
ncbi:receptor-transporting protein 5 [Suricata suricatta]|uniref:3CxxC-type domain-containing protein n=1 Tax=Suricata suricatta TaxID=37032 RepID=A0A673SSQ3_SURSU|nr:receptor-transporting protein 5 [Suricata suricatta]